MNSRKLKKYKIDSKYRFAELRNFSLQYSEWVESLNEITVIGAQVLDGMPRGTQTGNPTLAKATKAAELQRKIDLVQKCIRHCAEDETLQRAVLYAVTNENVSFNTLKARGLLLYERDAYYIARHRFYYNLDKMLH